jgi:PAS domain S-box-containing protein
MSSATPPSELDQQMRDMNEALLVSSVKQHELAEQIEKAHAVVRDSEERYRTLFDLCPVAIYSCDISGVIQKFNRGAVDLWGRTPELGDTDERFCGSFKLFRPDGSFMPHEQCPMAEVLSGKIAEARDAEVLIERPDGSRVNVIVNIRAVKNQRGEVTEAINCFYDITERFRMETLLHEQTEALADLHRRKDEFLAMLAHELRNPLAAISNSVQLLRLQKDENRLQQQARAVIGRQVTQLTRLVDDLMEVSRITTGRVQLRQDRVVMNGIVERAVETARPLMDQHKHELTVSLPPQPIWVNADAARLEQVVINLLTNAAKYTGEGGHIWLTVQQESGVRDQESGIRDQGTSPLTPDSCPLTPGEWCVLRVRDTGVGISPEFLPRIFELFTQAERSLDRSQGGLGIGLALVHRLVEMHGGRVEAYSALGQGSEFVVRLPVVVSPALQPSSTPTKTAEPAGPSLRILVVDDNEDTAQTTAMFLEELGHHVRKGHDGSTAVEVALDYHPDVVLLDIGLPGLNGYEVATRMRQQPALHNIVLVAITGYGQEADRQRSKKAGFDHHLVKPADFDKVQQILATVSKKAP